MGHSCFWSSEKSSSVAKAAEANKQIAKSRAILFSELEKRKLGFILKMRMLRGRLNTRSRDRRLRPSAHKMMRKETTATHFCE
ncbi:hypothetical protein NPIL_484941 [Nephila pilipes]|uniref:Uncharacterized protein n=1 Tax=Nephila pilipes TaxID=299642 RepID=A0A8X6PS38_NEPPI|nr:hypothetical protein NPIL_484941 [Nephila pilipes]